MNYDQHTIETKVLTKKLWKLWKLWKYGPVVFASPCKRGTKVADIHVLQQNNGFWTLEIPGDSQEEENKETHVQTEKI